MRDLLKTFLIGLVVFFAPQVSAESYKVLIIPDNIVTESAALDSYIYNASAEFFADEIINLLNGTDYITAPTVSETRTNLKINPTNMLAAKSLTSRFKTTYNVDYVTLKKIASTSDARYALLITSYIDSENYVLRRTVWDVLNIPGATVVDPAYKISTYATLVDTQKNIKLWSDTFYKTISVCENRIITRGVSPQTEQLQKIKDYSRYISPQIAEVVQAKILPPEIMAKESNQIHFDIGNIDNVFTKKYRHIGKETGKIYDQRKADVCEFVDETKVKVNETKDKLIQANKERKARKLEKEQAKLKEKLEVKATPYYETENETEQKEESIFKGFKGINFKKNNTGSPSENIVPATNQTPIKMETKVNYYNNPEYIDSIDIKKTRKNRLIEVDTEEKPALRDYYQ